MLSVMHEAPVVRANGVNVCLELGELPPAAAEVAANELRESPAIRTKALAELRELLKSEYQHECVCFYSLCDICA